MEESGNKVKNKVLVHTCSSQILSPKVQPKNLINVTLEGGWNSYSTLDPENVVKLTNLQNKKVWIVVKTNHIIYDKIKSTQKNCRS